MTPQATEQQEQQAGSAAIQAALTALGAKPEIDDFEESEVAMRVVRATAAAEASMKASRRANGAYVLFNASQAVATAYYFWKEGLTELLLPNEVYASSYAASQMLAFARGISAAQLMSDALSLLDDGGEVYTDGTALSKLISRDCKGLES